MKLVCDCCGFEQEFKDAEEAFQAGWDGPPHFTGFVVCSICPAVCVVLHKGHLLAHALWAAEGRPAEWSMEKCATDDDFGDPEAAKEFDEFFNAAMTAKKGE